MISDERLVRDLEPVLKALHPRSIVKSFFATWVGIGTIVTVASILGSDGPFTPSPRGLAVIVFGSALAAIGPEVHRVWTLRRYLTRTHVEIRDRIARDWLLLTTPGWPSRMLTFGLGASCLAGGLMGSLFALLFPDDRLLGSGLATVGAMIALFAGPVVALVFGMRALMVRQIARLDEPGEEDRG